MAPGDPESQEQRSQERFTAMRKTARRSQAFGSGIIVGVALFVAVASTAVSVWNVGELKSLSRDTRRLIRNEIPIAAAAEVEKVLREREREFGTQSIRCVLEQLSEHRHLNAVAHRAEAAKLGYSYPVPPDQEPPPVSTEETVCAKFLEPDQPG